MSKDVIYIDVEDDITGIIDRVKKSEDKIIALVPPKRIGVLQSVVNLRLLKRAAEKDDKHLVIITGNNALSGLAGSAGIPIAKSLQSKPEVPEIPVLEIDDNDIIDGVDLNVGEHTETIEFGAGSEDFDSLDDHSSTVEKLENDSYNDENPDGGGAKKIATLIPGKKIKEPKATKKGKKVPDFNSFRKKFFIILLTLILLIGFIVWAVFIAPSAKIMITAKTSTVSLNKVVKFSDSETSFANGNIKANEVSEVVENSVDFTATGKKEVGEKATGKVVVSAVVSEDNIDNLLKGITISAGTQLSSSSGAVYTLDSDVTVNLTNRSGVSGSVTAKEGGSKYNAASGTLTGGNSAVNIRLSSPTSGGTDKTVTVVSQSDMDQAKAKVSSVKDDSMFSKLKTKAGTNSVVIDQSYLSQDSEAQANVTVDQEVSGGKITVKTTYSVTAVDKNELQNYLKSGMNTEIAGKQSQYVYDDGVDTVKFSNYAKNADGSTVQISSNGQVGPKIDESKVKKESQGKKYNEVRSSLEAIDGISEVDIKFYPFWVNKVPSDSNKIKVEFKLNESQ